MQKTTLLYLFSSLMVLPQLAQAQALFTRVVNNGTVSPAYAVSTACTLSQGGARILTTGQSIQFPRPLLKAIAFTSAVPNLDVALSLKKSAELAPLQNAIGPIGGGRSTYLANASESGDSEVVLLVSSGKVQIQYRNSDAAKKLIAWIDHNCN